MMTDKENIGLSLRFSRDAPEGEWRITKGDPWDEEVLWSRPYGDDGEGGEHGWPADMRQEYERLIGRGEFESSNGSWNIVEAIADESSFDQPCRFGNRVEGHAVYCHNDAWLYSPRKCRRTWYTGGEVRDEDCPGFEAQG